VTAAEVRKLALVIDDDGPIREVLQTLLETAGFEVHTLSDGIDAVELKTRYDVILLDMKMPIFDAARLTDYWKLTAPEVLRRVILLTGYTHAPSDRDLGTFATLAKPFDNREVLRTVEACIRSQRSDSSPSRP
jgi:two-component system, OmpR family, response regulator